MAEKAEIPSLERITFFTGQRLTASDLAALQRAQRELRWLHNRGLHGWGIGIGLEVTGERGDSAVMIEPGYGIDCLGREIILTERRTKPVPADAGEGEGDGTVYYLTAAYQTDEAQKVAERRPGVCLPAGTVRLSEEPLLDWRRQGQVREGMELILGQVAIRNCRLNSPVSPAARRYARPLQQPYIAAGQTETGKTPWQTWGVAGTPLGVVVSVDTSAARFHATPRYIAHVAGNRHSVSGLLVVVITGIAAVVDATPRGFTLQMRTDPPAFGGPDGLPIFVRDTLKWHVVWMGVEG